MVFKLSFLSTYHVCHVIFNFVLMFLFIHQYNWTMTYNFIIWALLYYSYVWLVCISHWFRNLSVTRFDVGETSICLIFNFFPSLDIKISLLIAHIYNILKAHFDGALFCNHPL